MGLLKALITRFQVWRKRREPFAEVVSAAVNQYAGGIFDNIDYTVPLTVPGWLKQELGPERLSGYLQEAAEYWHHQFDKPYNNDVPFSPTTEDPLMEWDHQTRERVLSKCHEIYNRNPQANAAVQYTADFVIGDGFQLTTKNKEVEAVLNEFIDNPDNAWREYERQAVIDLQVDGELFLRFFEDTVEAEDDEGETVATGSVVAVPQRPWECEWIDTEEGFFRRPTTYFFQRERREGDKPTGQQGTQPDKIAADEILHVAINRHGYELRGRPELYRVIPWLRAHKEYLENRARQNVWRNALLWHIMVDSNNASAIAAIKNLFAKPLPPGSNAVTSAKVQIDAKTNNVGANDAAEDGRQIRMQFITGMRMAEYMLGDGENANLASATAQQLPAMTKFDAFQTVMINQVHKPVLKRVLQRAIDAGRLPGEVEEQDIDGDPLRDEVEQETPQLPPQMTVPQPANGTDEQPNGATPPAIEEPKQGPVRKLKTLDAFDVKYEPISQDDIGSLATALNLFLMNDIIDKDTAREEAGFDPQMIKKRIKKEQLERMMDIAQGRSPMPPFMRPEGQPGDEDGDEDETPEPQPDAA